MSHLRTPLSSNTWAARWTLVLCLVYRVHIQRAVCLPVTTCDGATSQHSANPHTNKKGRAWVAYARIGICDTASTLTPANMTNVQGVQATRYIICWFPTSGRSHHCKQTNKHSNQHDWASTIGLQSHGPDSRSCHPSGALPPLRSQTSKS
jgi:hypothetical protein